MSSHRRIRTLLILIAVVSTAGAVIGLGAKPAMSGIKGELTVTPSGGSVMVNGAAAVSGATVFSDSSVETAKQSSAVVSLGKLGRVEVLPETTMKLSFTDSSITADVSKGQARIISEVDKKTIADASNPQGQLRVVGQVTVNGQNAISGATVFSDSTVTTAKGSSAVVSIGKLGRVEVMPSSTMNLKFDGGSITAMLSAGRVRVSSGGM